MRGWGSSFVLSLVGAALLWIGVLQLDKALVRETRAIEGRVAQVLPSNKRYAIAFAGRAGRFELPTPSLPHPTADALRDAASVAVVYDARPMHDNAQVIVGLSVDGRAYFSPATYRLTVGLWALVVLVPGATLFGFGVSALLRAYREKTGPSDLAPEYAVALPQSALIIPFPGRPR